MTDPEPALRISDLSVAFDRAPAPAVREASFSVAPGQTVALIGASGSGKTTTCRAVLGLLPPSARVTGSITLAGTELVGLSDRELRSHRGAGVAMVFQNPDAALDPTRRVGRLIVDAIRRGRDTGRREAVDRTLDLLRQVQLDDPERVYRSYPHQLSGGMRQRVLIALSLSRRPAVLIADEPTTALDPATQAAVMDLLASLQRRLGLAMVLVSHDIALATRYADDVVVMHGGRVVDGFRAAAAKSPERHPRTAELVQDSPARPARSPSTSRRAPLLKVTDLAQDYRSNRPALAGVSFEIGHGERLAVVGESGSGKSTLAHSILHLSPPTSGRIAVDGVDLAELSEAGRRRRLRDIQLVFQDPLGSLDPTWKVPAIVAEPLRAGGMTDRAARRRRVQEVLDLVGLDPSVRAARPRELSGGQIQLVAIARALAPSPSLLVCDEALSSLDTVTKARIVALLRRLGPACLFITHDLQTAARLSDRVAVMHHGRLREIGPTGDVLGARLRAGVPSSRSASHQHYTSEETRA